MRTSVLAALTMVTAFGPNAAEAQRIGYPGASFPAPGAYPVQPGGPPVTLPAPPPPGSQLYPGQTDPGGASRWGGSVGGRWYGGTDAPGGWNAYHRPYRGWRMPSYWNSASFIIDDYADYGLFVPPSGYRWQRYYDDAVLLDPRGRVYDWRDGIDWNGGAASAYAPGGSGYGGSSGYGYGYAEDSYARSQQRRYVEQPDYAPLPPPSRHGAVTTYTTGGYGGGYAGGYGGGTTVVTIQPTETVTTTTTEYVEQTRYAPRHVYRAPKRIYRAKPRCSCKRVVRYVERPLQGS